MTRSRSSLLAAVVCCFALIAIHAAPLAAQDFSAAIVFFDAGFPAADSAGASRAQLENALSGAHFASSGQLDAQLNDASNHLLVLPYGSAFPEQNWASILSFLHRGGNLLVIGGRPFTRSAYHDQNGWHLREYSVRFTRQLSIDQYQTMPGSEGLSFETNSDVTIAPPQFHWKRAFSPVIRLSVVDLYNRGGSAGAIDARLDALAWGTKDGRRLAAPAIQIDHYRVNFDGGRWIFVNAELASDFYGAAESSTLLRSLAERAAQGAEEFTVRPALPLYLPGEPIELEILWHSSARPDAPVSVRISTFPEDQPSSRANSTINLPTSQPFVLPAPAAKGLHVIEAELLDGNKTRVVYRSAFWIRDDALLRSGPRLSVNRDYFELDGKPLGVVGTTYMSSDVQRLYFEHPNVYIWNRDLAQIHSAGLNMLRTGWWTGWDKLCDENGQPYERTLRTIEAYLMTARKYGFPVQFNFFAFLPDILAGENSYLDPEALRRQETLISAVVARFHDVPYLAWDLINEPSISKHLWTMRPNVDPVELIAWNKWLAERYPDRAALAAAWNVPASSVEGTIPLPLEIEFTPRGMYVGHNSLKLYDFYFFAQSSFAGWVKEMRETIREAGSQQLITVGQDEGGYVDRLSPAFFGASVDFTTNHSWWQNDASLWDSLVAKQPDQPMLIQETGIQRELTLDEIARRTPENEAALIERKIATSFVEGSGAIEWLWNSNAYMTESNETPIGALESDGTEKPEAGVMRAYAAFAKSLGAHLQNPQQPSVAIITSQAAQFSAIQDLQIEAQRNAVRALAYGARYAPYVVAENRIGELGSPALAILPSPQSLAESTWRTLLKYVNDGGNLLITGPLDRDEHWNIIARESDLNVDGYAEPLTYHTANIHLNDRDIPLGFNLTAQSALESLRFKDGSTLKEIPYGKGRVFWAAYPVELAEGLTPATELYKYVTGRISLKLAFALQTALSPGVLIYPTVLDDSVLYILVSDSADDTNIDLRDNLTGARLTLTLKSQHAALALIDKQSKSVIAKYGF
jgi:hypothetical protein